MKRICLLLVSTSWFVVGIAQDTKTSTPVPVFQIEKTIPATPVKNQAMTGTCWCFSTTSLVESQCLKNNLGELDLSEMFTVRNIYIEKAHNYVLRQGHAQFGEGGLGHDLIRAIATYGAMPESVYSGLKPGQKMHDHQKMSGQLKNYLDSILKISPVPANWMAGYKAILDDAIGIPPTDFVYNGKKYTPQSFAKEVLKFNPDDYVNITSFTHHPYYQSFILEVPDNFSNGSYYNLPLNDMIDLARTAIKNGYSVLWDADVSNKGFHYKTATAVYNDETQVASQQTSMDATAPAVVSNTEDGKWDAATRQQLFESLITQDDHLMHITGLEKSSTGKEYFLVKNSWGEGGPAKGYLNVSEGYFAINTVSLVVPKAALSAALLEKLKIR
jgi:bleomycin hydrolase